MHFPPPAYTVLDALKPLVDIANAYDNNALDDEARKLWGKDNERMNTTPLDEIILYTGRGGKTLLTLGDCIRAREVSDRYKRDPTTTVDTMRVELLTEIDDLLRDSGSWVGGRLDSIKRLLEDKKVDQLKLKRLRKQLMDHRRYY